MADFHGINTVEVSTGTRSIAVASTSVIGVVVTGPAADAATFPLDTPVAITDIETAIGKAGATGTIKGVLRAMADQAKAVVVVVRVNVGADTAAANANAIGTTTAAGVRTGMQALLSAEALTGVRPRILGAPGLDTQAVTTALVIVAQKLRGRVYAAAIGADVAAAVAYRANFTARELTLIWGDFQATLEDGTTGTSAATARALGLRAFIDNDAGFYKTLSNVAVQGVTGITKAVSWDLANLATDAGTLNAAGIVAIVRTSSGFRFWGNRTCSDDALFAFEGAVRTAQVLLDTIGAGLLWAIDKPLRPSLAKDIVETINGLFRQMKSQGALIGATAWFDATKNTSDLLAAGKLWIDYDYTPVPPLEQLTLTQRITDSYFADFAQLVSGSAS